MPFGEEASVVVVVVVMVAEEKPAGPVTQHKALLSKKNLSISIRANSRKRKKNIPHGQEHSVTPQILKIGIARTMHHPVAVAAACCTFSASE